MATKIDFLWILLHSDLKFEFLSGPLNSPQNFQQTYEQTYETENVTKEGDTQENAIIRGKFSILKEYKKHVTIWEKQFLLRICN